MQNKIKFRYIAKESALVLLISSTLFALIFSYVGYVPKENFTSISNINEINGFDGINGVNGLNNKKDKKEMIKFEDKINKPKI